MTEETKNVAHAVEDNTTITLKGEDAAMVLRESGQMEIFFPDKGEEASVNGPSLAIFKLAMVFKNPEIGKLLDDMFDRTIAEIEGQEKTNEAAQASPVNAPDSGSNG